MRNFTKTALATACLLGAGTAYAGTEACFEVLKGGDDAIISEAYLETLYTLANCESPRTGASATGLAAIDEARIAYELTGNLDVDFETVDTAGTDDLEIVYIPTSDIPGSTVIKMTLAGATFANNADIIHLVQEDTLGVGNPVTTTFSSVAATDGSVDGETEITFLTKSGVTITAGTRLVLSRVSTGASQADLGKIGINIDNTVCTTPGSTSTVTLAANSVITDGGNGFPVAGGVSDATTIVDISAQFVTFHNSTSVDGEVNAESTNSIGTGIIARTEFVYDADTTLDDTLTHNKSQIISKAGFADWILELDQFIILDGDDHLETAFVTSADPSAIVEAGIFNSIIAATGVLTVADQIAVETGIAFGTIDQAGAIVYNTEATDLFTPDVGAGDAETIPNAGAGELFENLSTWNNTWYVLENTESPLATAMNFNYTHTPSYTLDFGTADELDHCTVDKQLHNIGVNGAVLKVPYTYDTSNNWVRITNEHTESAEITLDIFDESGNQKTSVDVGNVGEHASVVLRADALIDLAVADGYAGTGNRHTMTFTVTAPKDSVHGVSIQTIPGGVDRVMPVLDQNVWTQ
jgi:hypothetical protein